MASSIDQHWIVQHQAACHPFYIMDSHNHPSSGYPVNCQQQQQLSASTQDSAIDPSVIQPPPPTTYYNITNVQHNFGPHNTVFPGGQLPSASGNNPGGGQTPASVGGGFASGSNADYYSGECSNLQPVGAYDHPNCARGSSSVAVGLPLSSSQNQNQYHHHQQQPPTTKTTTQHQFYQSTAAVQQEPPAYYSPDLGSYHADYHQDQQYSSQPAPQMYVSNYGGGQVASDSLQQSAPSTSMAVSSISTPSGRGDQHQQLTTTSGARCSPTTSTTFTILEDLKQPASAKPGRADLPNQELDYVGESVALLDSTSNRQLPSGSTATSAAAAAANERAKIKTKPQPADHLISSCHTNRVRAGPLGIISRRKNATRETTAILKEWLDEHGHNPYPSKGEKIMLSCVTKMSMTQVSTWFANARRRMKREKRSFWATGSAGQCGAQQRESQVMADGGGLSRSGPSCSLSTSLSTKVKSEYAKAVMASSPSSAACPALKYFMQKHHKQQQQMPNADGRALPQQQQQPETAVGCARGSTERLNQPETAVESIQQPWSRPLVKPPQLPGEIPQGYAHLDSCAGPTAAQQQQHTGEMKVKVKREPCSAAHPQPSSSESSSSLHSSSLELSMATPSSATSSSSSPTSTPGPAQHRASLLGESES